MTDRATILRGFVVYGKFMQIRLFIWCTGAQMVHKNILVISLCYKRCAPVHHVYHNINIIYVLQPNPIHNRKSRSYGAQVHMVHKWYKLLMLNDNRCAP